LSKDNEAAEACLNEALSLGGQQIRKKLGIKKELDPESGFVKAYDRSMIFAKSAAHRIIYQVLPYPLSAFYFLHWQIGVSVMAFLVVPVLMGAWASYQALGTRNYFATNPPAYKNNRIVDGPLWDEVDEADYHDSQDDDDVSFDSSTESPHDHAHRPLAKRAEHTYPQGSYKPSSPIPSKNIVRVNPGSAKVVAGRNYV